jgi:type II secretory pathway component GspD/PulD (secretin)
MKITTLIALTVGMSILACCQMRAQTTNKETVSINFVNVPANQVLDDYQRMTHRGLLVASNVRLGNQHITFHFEGSPDAVPPLLEQTLLKQAGIVITRLDDKRATVTIPNETNNVTYELFKHDPINGAPFAAYAITGVNAEVVEAQLLAITNSSGQRICGSLSQPDATTINFYFLKTNGVPYRVHLEVK